MSLSRRQALVGTGSAALGLTVIPQILSSSLTAFEQQSIERLPQIAHGMGMDPEALELIAEKIATKRRINYGTAAGDILEALHEYGGIG